jgi:hypothetical protein
VATVIKNYFFIRNYKKCRWRTVAAGFLVAGDAVLSVASYFNRRIQGRLIYGEAAASHRRVKLAGARCASQCAGKILWG